MANTIPAWDEAKKVSELVNILKGAKNKLLDVIKGTQGVNQEQAWDYIMKKHIQDPQLGIDSSIGDILQQRPEFKTMLRGYLNNNVYTGMRGYFLNLYRDTDYAITQIQKELSSGSMKGIDKLLIKAGEKSVTLPAMILTYIIGKPLLMISGYGSGIYGGKPQYLSDIFKISGDDLKLQATTLLHMSPILGHQFSELLHLNNLENRVHGLISDMSSRYILNQLRAEQGLDAIAYRSDAPSLFSAFKDKVDKSKIDIETKVREYGSRLYDTVGGMASYTAEKIGYKVQKPLAL